MDGLDKFTVVAPRLIHFKCMGTPLERISLRGRPCLESACIRSIGLSFDWQSGFTGIILHAKRLELFLCPRMKVCFSKNKPIPCMYTITILNGNYMEIILCLMVGVANIS